MLVTLPLWRAGSRVTVSHTRGVGWSIVRWKCLDGAIYGGFDEEDPPEGGVREPRRPVPPGLHGAAVLTLHDETR